MRFFHLALFVFILQLVGGVFSNDSSFASGMGLNVTMKVDAPSSQMIQNFTQTQADIGSRSKIGSGNPLSDALGWFFSGMMQAAQYLFSAGLPIVNAVIWLPMYLAWIGIPSVWAGIIYTILLVIEVVGFYEFFFGRDIER